MKYYFDITVPIAMLVARVQSDEDETLPSPLQSPSQEDELPVWMFGVSQALGSGDRRRKKPSNYTTDS